MTPTSDMTGVVDHPSLGPVRYTATVVSDHPELQVADVIGMMRKYCREDHLTPEIYRDAYAAIEQYAPQVLNGTFPPTGENARAAICAVYHYVSSRLQFVHDEDTGSVFSRICERTGFPLAETLQRPVDISTAAVKQGDCDDFAMYAACLLMAVGIKQVAFVTVAADSRDPSRWSHVYVCAYADDVGRVPIDCSHGPECGWEKEGVYRRKEWMVTNTARSMTEAVLVGGLFLGVIFWPEIRKALS